MDVIGAVSSFFDPYWNEEVLHGALGLGLGLIDHGPIRGSINNQKRRWIASVTTTPYLRSGLVTWCFFF
jgi:hypothetical protein